MNDDELKAIAKDNLRLRGDYHIWDVLEAIVMNDSAKLDEIKERGLQLQSVYEKFVEEIDSGNEDRRSIAISSLRRPD